jgi:hypothetical protein
MNPESYSHGMNGLMDLWINRNEIGSRGTSPAPWDGDWRLAIAEERVATAQAKLAAAEQRVKELSRFASR